MQFLRLVLVAVLVFQDVLTAEWSYVGENGPNNWPEIFPDFCAGRSQSPINIYEGDVVPTEIPRFTFINYDTSVGVTMGLTNNGHTAVVDLGGSTEIQVSGGGLPEGPYKALQLHFHWGVNSMKGSEHLLNTHSFPMEMHIVHTSNSNWLAVLGFFFEVSNTDNPNYDEIVNNLNRIRTADTEVSITSFPLDSLLPNTFEHFYRYNGSLTTPACSEIVRWTVFKDTIPISERQLSAFRELLTNEGGPLVNNFRPVQALNDRTVLANYEPHLHWTYGHFTVDISDGVVEASWSNYYQSCGGKSQSPIDLKPRESQLDTSIPNFVYSNYNDDRGVTMTFSNNGHTVVANIGAGSIAVSGGGLPETYQAAQFHLHWGASDMRGSEHLVDSAAYPAELHIVHFKRSLGNIGVAIDEPEGLAVLGFFFEISESDNPALNPIVNALPRIRYSDNVTSLTAFNLESILPSDRSQFYRYSGSLTTPGCFESVIWTVFRSTIKISARQLTALRGVSSKTLAESTGSDKERLVDNYRTPQKLNGRVVKVNFVAAPADPDDIYWTYNAAIGVSTWPVHFPACASTPASRQSPIDIEPTEASYEKIPSLTLRNFDSQNINLKMINTGRTLQVNIMNGNLHVYGGGLEGTFKAAQMVFHWGSDVYRGSEHRIGNVAFAMEMQLILYNDKFGSLKEAMTRRNGLSIFGFMFEVSMAGNSDIDSFVNSVDDVVKTNSSTSLNSFPVNKLLPSSLNDFYRYEGSMTYPGCYETVTWTIFRETIKISKDQLMKFQSLKASSTLQLVNNYRPLQPINGRPVMANFYIGSGTTVRPGLVLLASTLLWAAVRFTSLY